MRCSLLTLSTYLDGELATDRAAEVDAHLIGCSRCSTGLGYLREEADRIRTLARVQVPDYSTHQLLAEVGLIASGDDLPGEGHVATIVAPAADTPPWYSTESGKALPWDPRHPARERSIIGRPAPAPMARIPAVEQEVDFTPPPPPLPVTLPAPEPEPDAIHELEPEAAASAEKSVFEAKPDEADVADSPDIPTADPFVERGYAAWGARPEEIRNGQGDAVEVGGASVHEPLEPDAMDPAATEPDSLQPAAHEPGVIEPDAIEPAAIDAPERAARGAMGSFVSRMRDAVAVRLALRHSAAGDLDDSVQIVSGVGAPTWGGQSNQHSYRERRDQQVQTAAIAAAARLPVETPDVSLPDDIATPVSAPYEYAPMHDDVADVVELQAAPPVPSVAPPAPAIPEIPDTPDTPAPAEIEIPTEPGRHMRSVERGKEDSPPWDFAALREHAVRKASRSWPGSNALGDRRLWAIGIAVLGLMLIGLLIGKSMSSVAPRTTAVIPPNPTAVASAPVHASATPAPTTVPTPRPTPPPAPSASRLTSPLTLGTGAAGYSVADQRYGSHPGDFRIVFDLSGPAGATPKVVTGFGNATTLYVEFEGVAGGTPSAPPPGQIVSSVKLLKPSPIAGRTIYEFTLTRGAHLGAFYLAGPTRLVIDLT